MTRGAIAENGAPVTKQAAETERGGRGATRSLATRDILVELAADLFSEHGYIQTSIRDIARRGGLTTGAIYGHFRNKADLLVEAINSRIEEELESLGTSADGEVSHVETLTKLSELYPQRRRLRALIVQGAAAAPTDEETRDRLRELQLAHLNAWVDGYQADRERLGIDPSVDLRTAVLYTWAAEVGLGVLEAVGIEPSSRRSWGDMAGRFGRALRLPPDTSRSTATAGTRRRGRPASARQ